MKQAFFTLILSLITINLSGQSLTLDQLIKKIKNDIIFEELKTIVDQHTNQKPTTINQIDFRPIISRKIFQLDNYQEIFYEIGEVNAKGNLAYPYRVRFLVQGNQLVNTTIWDVTKTIKTNVIHPKAFLQYQIDFQTANYKVSDQGLFEPDTMYTVSIQCGKTTKLYDKFQETLDLISSKNKDKILAWSQSTSPEIRCYGAIGLYGLKTSGHPLTKAETQWLNLISNDETIINHCSGCTNFGFSSSVKTMYQQGESYIRNNLVR